MHGRYKALAKRLAPGNLSFYLFDIDLEAAQHAGHDVIHQRHHQTGLGAAQRVDETALEDDQESGHGKTLHLARFVSINQEEAPNIQPISRAAWPFGRRTPLR